MKYKHNNKIKLRRRKRNYHHHPLNFAMLKFRFNLSSYRAVSDLCSLCKHITSLVYCPVNSFPKRSDVIVVIFSRSAAKDRMVESQRGAIVTSAFLPTSISSFHNSCKSKSTATASKSISQCVAPLGVKPAWVWDRPGPARLRP